MAPEIAHVCMNCGIEAADARARRRMNHEVACSDPDSGDHHDWSDDDPLHRAIARIEAGSFAAHVVEWDDNPEWQWFEVSVDDPDVVGGSEFIAQDAQHEGFSFVGLSEGDGDGDSPAMRFNRQKDEAERESAADARAEIAAEGELEDRRERHFDRHGHF